MVKNYTNTILKIFKKSKSLIKEIYIPIVILLSFLLMILIIRRYENFKDTTDDCCNDLNEAKTEIATLQGDLNKQKNEAKQKETNLNKKITDLTKKYDKQIKDLKTNLNDLQGVDISHKKAAEKYSQIKNELDALTNQSNNNTDELNNLIKSLKEQLKRCEKGESFQDTEQSTTEQSITEQSDNNDLIIDQPADEGIIDEGTNIEQQINDDEEKNTEQTELIDDSKKFGITNLESDGKKTDSLDSDTADNQQILSLLNIDMESILGASKFKKIAEDQIKNDTRQNFRLNRISNILYKF